MSGRRALRRRVAVEPTGAGDLNRDGTVVIRDATAFGDLFNSEALPELLDLNGNGAIDVRDATTFGEIRRGEGANRRAWRGSTLPPKPE